MSDGPGDFRFGSFRLRVHSLELERDGLPVPLEPLPARLLVRLVERAGSLVPRRELLELGWPKLPDAAEDSLNTCVRQIREALGDDARNPRHLETLRGRGYRFITRVEACSEAPPRSTRRSAIAAAALLIALASGGLLWMRTSAEPSSELRASLARAEWMLEHGRDAGGALALVDSLVAVAPEVGTVHGLRAELRLFTGDVAGASRSARQALAADSDNAVAHRVVAHARAFAGDWAGADAAMRRALAADPRDGRTWIAQAFLLVVRGRVDAAEAALERALDVDPRSPLVNGDVGLLHLYAGRYQDALQACGAQLAAEPGAGWLLDCMVDANLLAGRTEEAERWAVRILGDGETRAGAIEALRARRIEVARSVPRPTWALALALADAGYRDEALAALEGAAAHPGFGVLTLAVDPRLAALHGHPRFDRVARRFGLLR